MVWGRAMHGQEHVPTHPRGFRGPDERTVPFVIDRPRTGSPGAEAGDRRDHRVDALHRGPERGWVPDVAAAKLDIR